MTELYRSDAELTALSATIGGGGAVFPTKDADPHYTLLAKYWSRVADALVPLTGLEVFKDGDLTFGVRSGHYLNGDTAVNYAGAAAQALTNNATNYIYLTAAGTLTVNTSAFPTPSVTPHIPLATIVTSGGLYSIDDGDIVDYRGRSIFRVCGRTAVRAHGVPLTALRKSAAAKDDLPDAADATELGLADTQGSTVKGTTTNNTTASEKAAVRVALPADYVDGQAVTLRVRAKVSAARQVSATVDAVVKECGDSLGADVCATAAQTLTTSFVNYDFTITPTDLVAGDELNIELALATNDTGGSTNGYPEISHVEVRTTDRVLG